MCPGNLFAGDLAVPRTDKILEYLPVGDLVRQLCGITTGEPRNTIAAKVHHRLQEANIAPDESVPLLLHLLDMPVELERLAQLSPPERKARTFALLRQLFLRRSRQCWRHVSIAGRRKRNACCRPLPSSGCRSLCRSSRP